MRERAAAQMEVANLLQQQVNYGGGGARDPSPSNERATPAGEGDEVGAVGLAEDLGGGRRGRMSTEEETCAVETVVRCGRLGLWGDARAVYDACAPRVASLARLQAALLAQL